MNRFMRIIVILIFAVLSAFGQTTTPGNWQTNVQLSEFGEWDPASRPPFKLATTSNSMGTHIIAQVVEGNDRKLRYFLYDNNGQPIMTDIVTGGLPNPGGVPNFFTVVDGGGDLFVFWIRLEDPFDRKIHGKKGVFSFNVAGEPQVEWVTITPHNPVDPQNDNVAIRGITCHYHYNQSLLRNELHIVGRYYNSHDNTDEIFYTLYNIDIDAWSEEYPVSEAVNKDGWFPVVAANDGWVHVVWDDFDADVPTLAHNFYHLRKQNIVNGSWDTDNFNTPGTSTSGFVPYTMQKMVFNDHLHIFTLDNPPSGTPLIQVFVTPMNAIDWASGGPILPDDNIYNVSFIASQNTQHMVRSQWDLNPNVQEIRHHKVINNAWTTTYSNVNNSYRPILEYWMPLSRNEQGLHVFWLQNINVSSPNKHSFFYNRYVQAIYSVQQKEYWTGNVFIADDNSNTATAAELTVPGGVAVSVADGAVLDLRGNHLVVEGELYFHSNDVVWGNNGQIILDGGTIIDFDEPAVPTNLAISNTPNGALLSWKANTEADLAGYEVYRQINGGSVYKISGSNLVTDTTFSLCDILVTNNEYEEHSYFVEAIDNFENASGFSTPLTVNIEYISCRFEKVASGTQGDAGTIEKFSLNANYPNPFNPTTTIAFALSQDSPVRLTVFDSNGRQIAELVNKQLSAGSYEIPFDASAFSSGVYFYRLTAGAFTQTHKMLLTK